MEEDVDSAGVYFLSVEDFEWRPGRTNPTERSADRGADRGAERSTERAAEDAEKGEPPRATAADSMESGE